MRAVAAILSLALHAALVLGMSALPDRATVAAPKRVELKVVKREPPPPPPAPPEAKKDEPLPPPEVKPKVVKKKTVEKVIADEPKPQPKAADPTPPPEKPQPPPGGFSVDMSATVNAGGVAVPAVEGGGNMFADPADKSKQPGAKTAERPRVEAGKGKGTAPAGGYQITEIPQLLTDPESLKPRYPPSAQEKQIEGQVLLDVLVDATGRVAEVKVKRRLDPECDAEAVRLVRDKVRFRPAMAGDQAVPMWIPFSVLFELER